ncbi:hypothetical protein BH23GEM4_BH23GEM4_06800 [soil metagenome]
MATVAKLRDKARVLEGRAEWQEALKVYYRVLEEASAEEMEIGLYNRLGDLHLRLDQGTQAVEAYGQAVESYAEAGLHNNAIALCKKILRINPARTETYLRLGQISAAKGFLADARDAFLRYAEIMQKGGRIDESFDALKEFAELFPDDTEVRRLLADQLRAHGRDLEAAEQLALLDAGAPAAVEDSPPAAAVDDASHDLELMIELPPPEPPTEVESLPGLSGAEEALEAADDVPLLDGLEPTLLIDPDAVELDPAADALEPSDAADGGESFPTLEIDTTWDEAEEGSTASWSDDDLSLPPAVEVEDPLDRLRSAALGEPADAAARAEVIALLRERGRDAEAAEFLDAAAREYAARGAYAAALESVRELLAIRPGDSTLLQRQVEYAFRCGVKEPLVEALRELARGLRRLGREEPSRAVFRRLLELAPHDAEARAALEPAPPAGGYIDLRAMVLEERTGGASTRFVVEAEEPSGDEDRDFADMLRTFRDKVAEHIEAEDSSSHYDLGLAFMEMGLTDEAIGQFQVALQGGANPVATLEVLAKCFARKGQHGVASRVLERATCLPGASDSELIGVLYELAEFAESEGRREQALEYLERVISVDISFRDAANRAAGLHRVAEL